MKTNINEKKKVVDLYKSTLMDGCINNGTF